MCAEHPHNPRNEHWWLCSFRGDPAAVIADSVIRRAAGSTEWWNFPPWPIPSRMAWLPRLFTPGRPNTKVGRCRPCWFQGMRQNWGMAPRTGRWSAPKGAWIVQKKGDLEGVFKLKFWSTFRNLNFSDTFAVRFRKKIRFMADLIKLLSKSTLRFAKDSLLSRLVIPSMCTWRLKKVTKSVFKVPGRCNWSAEARAQTVVTFTVRKVSNGVGVEEFSQPFHHQLIRSKYWSGVKVHRAKLNYLEGPSRKIRPYQGKSISTHQNESPDQMSGLFCFKSRFSHDFGRPG